MLNLVDFAILRPHPPPKKKNENKKVSVSIGLLINKISYAVRGSAECTTVPVSLGQKAHFGMQLQLELN